MVRIAWKWHLLYVENLRFDSFAEISHWPGELVVNEVAVLRVSLIVTERVPIELDSKLIEFWELICGNFSRVASSSSDSSSWMEGLCMSLISCWVDAVLQIFECDSFGWLCRGLECSSCLESFTSSEGMETGFGSTRYGEWGRRGHVQEGSHFCCRPCESVNRYVFCIH